MRKVCALSLLAALADSACGGATMPAPVVKLETPKPTVSIAARKAAACRGGFARPSTIVASAELPDEHRVVRSVSIHDEADHVVAESRDLPLKTGEKFDAARAREAVRRIWATGKYGDVVVDSAPQGDGVAITFRVMPTSSIDQLFVDGASEDDLRGMHARVGGPYEPGSFLSAARSIEGSYHDRGYLDASFHVGSAATGDGRFDLCIAAKIGPLVTIASVDFEGTTHEADLRNAVQSPHNVPGGILDSLELERDELLVAARLYDLGYLSHKLTHRLDRRGDQIRIVFVVEENSVYRIGKVEIKGDLAAPKNAYERLITLKRGDVFNRSKFIADMDAIRALDKATGRKEIDLEPITNIDSDKLTVDISLEIHDPNKSAKPTPPSAGTGKLQIVDLVLGHGAQARNGDHVSVHYVGTLPSGTVFDSSRAHNSPFVFVLGGKRVIAGFDQGVLGMRVGGKRRVTIPPELGYGDRGAPPSIPPKATLIFELELIAINPP